MAGITLASLYPRADDRRLYAWYNISSPAYNGTGVEGDKSLDLSDFFFQQIVANNLAVAALTLYIWEYISTLYDEVHLYRFHKFFSRHVILFILVRYGTLPSLILPAFSVWHDFSMDSDGCLQHQQLAICVVQLIVSIVFAWRTVAIWGHGRRITIFFIIIVCLQFGASFGLLWFSEEKLLPNGACMAVTPKDGWNPLPGFYAIAFAYDLLTIGMSIYKLLQFSSLGRPEEPSDSIHWTRIIVSPTLMWKRVQIHIRAMSSSPLVERMTYSGLVYLIVATAYNACSFALEIRQDIHSKALITLYAPLMCILCQRIILLDVKAIWGGSLKGSDGSKEQALVDRVISERRLSWQGSDADPIESPRRGLAEKQGQEDDNHIAVNMNTSTQHDDMMNFQDMLNHSPSSEKQSKLHNWRSFGRKNGSDGADKVTSSPPSTSSMTSSHQPLAPASANMSENNKALALKMAGFEQDSPTDKSPST